MSRIIKITIFCEHNQDRYEPVRSVYPKGIHGALAEAFEEEEGFAVHIATQDMPEHGLTEEVLENTDVLVWWSHLDNPLFDDAVADRVCRHVVGRGMGFLCLHSSVFSKPWQRMLGIYYDAGLWGRFRTMPQGEKERLWTIAPGHPITDGLEESILIPPGRTLRRTSAHPGTRPDHIPCLVGRRRCIPRRLCVLQRPRQIISVYSRSRAVPDLLSAGNP